MACRRAIGAHGNGVGRPGLLPSSRGFTGLEGVARAVAAAGSAGGEGGLTHGGVAVACWICHGWMLGLLLPDPVESCSAAVMGLQQGGRPAGQPAAGGRAGKEEAPMLLLKGEGRPGQGGGATQPGKRVARASMVEMMSPWPGILVMAQGEAAVAEGD